MPIVSNFRTETHIITIFIMLKHSFLQYNIIDTCMHVLFIVAPKTNTIYVYISKMQKRMDTRL